jgi:hypothetical protein
MYQKEYGYIALRPSLMHNLGLSQARLREIRITSVPGGFGTAYLQYEPICPITIWIVIRTSLYTFVD